MELFDNIEALSKDDYDRVIEDFVETFSTERISLFVFGNIGNPGISDLDLCIVFDDTEIKPKELGDIVVKARDFTRKPGLHSYIFTHDILIYPASIFKYIRYLHTMTGLKLLFGSAPDLIVPGIHEDYFLQLSNFINFTGHSLHVLHRILHSPRVTLREVLLSLGSARHSLVYISNKQGELESLIAELSVIRNKYRDYNSQQILSLVKETYLGLLDAFIRVSKMESGRYFDVERKKDRYVFFLGTKIMKFTDNRTKGEHKLLELVLPLIYLYQGASYGHLGTGPYANTHATLFPMFIEIEVIPSPYKDILRLQVHLADTFASRYARYNISIMTPLCCFYFTPKRNLKWRALELFNRALSRMQKYNLLSWSTCSFLPKL